jgi:tetratricopeptide (TPR) repeat protein
VIARTEHAYTLRNVLSLLGISRHDLLSLIEAGFIQPARGPRNEMRLTFRDVVLLRTAHQLRSSNIASRKIVRALGKVREALPEGLPLSSVRLAAVGSEVAVRDSNTHWVAETGQMLFDFEDAPEAGSEVATHVATQDVVRGYLREAAQLADTQPREAEALYRKAIETSPEPIYEAYANLGHLLCEVESRYVEALDVLEAGLRHFPEDELLHFNRAVALEDMGKIDDAISEYEHCIKLAPYEADAHYNLARLFDTKGDLQSALRHWNAYRRLTA